MRTRMIAFLGATLLAACVHAQGFPPAYRGDRLPDSGQAAWMGLTSEYTPSGLAPDGRRDLFYRVEIFECDGTAWLWFREVRARSCEGESCCIGGAYDATIPHVVMPWNEAVGAYLAMVPIEGQARWSVVMLTWEAEAQSGTYRVGWVIPQYPYFEWDMTERVYEYALQSATPPACWRSGGGRLP